jgi:hypothetical protein
MTNRIYSTTSCSSIFLVRGKERLGNNMFPILRKIPIRGGANVKPLGPNSVTPPGVVTEVSDDDLAELNSSTVFQRMVERGFYKIVTVKKETPVEKVVDDMNPKDASAPKNVDDFKPPLDPVKAEKTPVLSSVGNKKYVK